MNIILLEDLKGVGAKGAMVHVKPGYARNFLLPRRLAIPAGDRAGQVFQELQRQQKVQDDKRELAARAEAAKLEGVEINIAAPANEEDTLFGSIAEGDIADALTRAGHAIDKRQIELPDHLKKLGRYEVLVRFHAGVAATVKVWVVHS